MMLSSSSFAIKRHVAPARRRVGNHASLTVTARTRMPRVKSQVEFIEVDLDTTWKMENVAERLKAGNVGIIPTDSFPAFVCDLTNREAVERMIKIKAIDPHKPLGILCRNFSDIATYTMGWPVNDAQGDLFKVAKKVLPGPYTFILQASKRLPAQVIDYEDKKTRRRNEVGVRMPGDPITQALLEKLDRPLLCTSVHIEDALDEEKVGDGKWLVDVGALADYYGSRGLDFVVSSGITELEGSTIIDLTSRTPKLVRAGKGDPTVFVYGEEAETVA